MLFICYPKCTTCQKAKQWLDSHSIAYETRDIKLNPPLVEELMKWHKLSHLPLKKFFNTSGLLYKKLQLKEKLATLNDNETIALLASDGMLVKRPILIDNNFIKLGFKAEEYETLKPK